MSSSGGKVLKNLKTRVNNGKNCFCVFKGVLTKFNDFVIITVLYLLQRIPI